MHNVVKEMSVFKVINDVLFHGSALYKAISNDSSYQAEKQH